MASTSVSVASPHARTSDLLFLCPAKILSCPSLSEEISRGGAARPAAFTTQFPSSPPKHGFVVGEESKQGYICEAVLDKAFRFAKPSLSSESSHIFWILSRVSEQQTVFVRFFEVFATR